MTARHSGDKPGANLVGMHFGHGLKGCLATPTISEYCISNGQQNPNDPQKLTGCRSTTRFVQIALTPKRAELVWIFLKQNNSLGQVVIH